jgi:hypothetical protein
MKGPKPAMAQYVHMFSLLLARRSAAAHSVQGTLTVAGTEAWLRSKRLTSERQADSLIRTLIALI